MDCLHELILYVEVMVAVCVFSFLLRLTNIAHSEPVCFSVSAQAWSLIAYMIYIVWGTVLIFSCR